MKDKSRAASQPAKRSWLPLVLRLIIGGVFIFSGFQKASSPAEEFAAIIQAYYIPPSILPPDWILPFAQVLPWIELIFGVFLIAGYLRRLSARVLACMLAMFVLALSWALFNHIPLENCGCFGSSGFHLSPRIGIMSDLCLLACAVWLSRKGGDPWSVDRWVESGR